MDAVLAEEHILLHLTTVFPQHLQRNSQQTETTIKEKSQLKLNIHKFFLSRYSFSTKVSSPADASSSTAYNQYQASHF
jgi:hypothetical protein